MERKIKQAHWITHWYTNTCSNCGYSVGDHWHSGRSQFCMMDKSDGNGAEYAAKTTGKPEPTIELDGDTEFERVIMTIPADATHMVKITHIFNKHMEGLAAVNRRAYNSIMEQLKEVAKA